MRKVQFSDTFADEIPLPTPAIRPPQKATFVLCFLPYIDMTTPKFFSLAREETSLDEW